MQADLCHPVDSLPLFLVQAVKQGSPCLALVARRLPELAHGAVGIVPEREFVLHGLAFKAHALAFEGHLTIGVGAVEMDDRTAVVDPGLLPFARLAIVDIEAVAHTALAADPVFHQDAAVEDAVDAVGAREFVADIDLPVADPEVKLTVFCRGARRGLGLRCLGECRSRQGYQDHKEGKCQFFHRKGIRW
jgi:hypothetical protein